MMPTLQDTLARRSLAAAWLTLALALPCREVLAAPACGAELGRSRADLLVRQCLAVAAANDAPCHEDDRCTTIAVEIERGCERLAVERRAPPFCHPPSVTRRPFHGTLVAGGGIDDYTLTVLADDGTRLRAYCAGRCGEWFEETGDGDRVTLRAQLLHRRVHAEIVVVRNGTKIAGAAPDARIPVFGQLLLLQ